MKQFRTITLKCGAWMLVTILAPGTVTSVSASSGRPSGGATQVSTSQKTSTESPEIQIDNFTFAPGSIIVKAGTQVTWINHDDIPHTVDSNGRQVQIWCARHGRQVRVPLRAAGRIPVLLPDPSEDDRQDRRAALNPAHEGRSRLLKNGRWGVAGWGP